MSNEIKVDKRKLQTLSISDLKAIRDYCAYQCEHRGFEFNKWSAIAVWVIEELEKRIYVIFKEV